MAATESRSAYFSPVTICFDADALRCHVESRYCKQPSGGYTAWIPALPGVVSEGPDLESAQRNVREALTAALEALVAERSPIPWRLPVEPPGPDDVVRWIAVTARLARRNEETWR